jgi:hypothetical protein
VFGTILEALILPSQFPPPVLSFSWQTNALTLEWAEPGLTLETATNAAGPWIPQPGITSPVSFPTTNAAGFFRLRQ